VRPGSRTKVSVPLVLPQTRHPERSASRVDRMTPRLWRGVEGPRRCLSYPCCSELFPPKLDYRICCDTHLMVTGTSSWFSAQGEPVAGLPGAGSVVENLRTSWVREAPPGSFDSAPQVLCHEINLRGAALRMTSLWEN
jgi:hypothetical protein